MNEPLFRNLQELVEWIGTYLPYATIGEDNEGQLVVYTNLYETDKGDLANYNDEPLPQCDICGEYWHDGWEGEDWNGDTGNHVSCETS